MAAEHIRRDQASLLDGQSTMTHAFDGLAARPPGSEGSWTPEGSSDMSDLDGATQLRLPARKPPAGRRGRGTAAVLSDGGHTNDTHDGGHGRNSDGMSKTDLQVTVDQSGSKSKHTFTKEDLQEIMRSGMQTEIEKTSGKSKGKIRNLVFTRQFTTFDRQNPSASQSPFHGFFTLFWISMAFLLVKIAAWNWKTQGSVFGNAEILHLMVDRDLFVLLATDGAMCALVSFFTKL
jgi:sterol O-acyltransferase